MRRNIGIFADTLYNITCGRVLKIENDGPYEILSILAEDKCGGGQHHMNEFFNIPSGISLFYLNHVADSVFFCDN